MKEAVNDDREFLTFVTHGLVILSTMKVLGIKKLDDFPAGIPSQRHSLEVRQRYLDSVASAVVDTFVFPHGVLPPDKPQQGQPGQPGQPEDYKHNYICALLREGLLDMARMDAVKQGDGDRIIRHWRYDFVHFHVFKHPNYRLLSFRMIAQIYALLTPRMAARVIHNRTVNAHGGIGCNISLDLFLEFLNKSVKEDLKRSGSALTDKVLQRVGQSKQVMDEFLHNFDREMELFTSIGRHKKQDWSGEVAQMVGDLMGENLFENQAGREFPSFPNFPMNRLHSVDREGLEGWVSTQLTCLHYQNL